MRILAPISAVLLTLLGMLWNEAFAFAYPVGVISNIYISGATNYAVRVYLNGVADPCGTGGSGFAYINAADSNYTVYVAGLLAAKAQGNRVSLLVVPDANNYCHLVEFNVGS